MYKTEKNIKFKKKNGTDLKFYKRKLKRYKKFKPLDQIQYFVSKYPNRGYSYKKRFKNTLADWEKINLFYGGFKKST
jgi:hypothetical protein